MNGRAYVTKEDDFIKTNYGKLRPSQIALKLGRSRPSIYHRVEDLGLLARRDSGEFRRRQSLPRTAKSFTGFKNGVDKGWVAGIIDGEGSIVKPPKVEVEVTTTTKPLVDHLWEICGGSVSGPYENRSGYNPHRGRPQYHWIMSAGADVYLFLQEVLPYLIIKRQAAKYGIEYYRAKFQ